MVLIFFCFVSTHVNVWAITKNASNRIRPAKNRNAHAIAGKNLKNYRLMEDHLSIMRCYYHGEKRGESHGFNVFVMEKQVNNFISRKSGPFVDIKLIYNRPTCIFPDICLHKLNTTWQNRNAEVTACKLFISTKQETGAAENR